MVLLQIILLLSIELHVAYKAVSGVTMKKMCGASRFLNTSGRVAYSYHTLTIDQIKEIHGEIPLAMARGLKVQERYFQEANYFSGTWFVFESEDEKIRPLECKAP